MTKLGQDKGVKNFVILIHPLFHLLVLALIAFFWMRSAQWFFLGYFVAVCISPLPYFLLKSWEAKIPPGNFGEATAKTVVVLGSDQLFYDDNLKTFDMHKTSDRIVNGVRLAKADSSRTLIFTGATWSAPSSNKLSESESAKQFALEFGLPESQIRIEPEATTTYENAKLVREFLKEGHKNGDKPEVILVSSSSHMPRAVRAFEKAGIKVQPFPVDAQALGRGYSPLALSSNHRYWMMFLYEISASLYYKLTR